MIKLIFIRHGATSGNLEKRYIGSTDEPLCDEGIEQAKKLTAQNLAPDCLFVSPMLRARQTADIVFPHAKKQIIDDFREMDFGMFEGKSAGELQDCRQYRAWTDAMCLTPVSEGESVTDFKARCINAFEKILREIPENSVSAFVVHGGVIMSIMEKFCEKQKNFYEYHIGNCEYILCEFDRSIYKLKML